MELVEDQTLEQALLERMSRKLRGADEADFSIYEGDPLGFLKDVLGVVHMWEKIKEIAESVWYHPYTAVKSANSVGKTFTSARVGTAWFNIFQDNCKVITTAAPPERQIKELLWGEIKSIYRQCSERGVALVGGNPGAMSVRVHDSWWMQGFTIPLSGTREERIARFQGHHAEHLLIIVDEAHGVPKEVFEAIERCMSGGHNHLLLLSNPLAPSGEFYNATQDPRFNVITIDAFSHPNVKTGKVVIPGCVTKDKTLERVKKWSRPLHDHEEPDEISCFKVPDYVGGYYGGQTRKITYPAIGPVVLGRYPQQAENSVYSLDLVKAAQDRWIDIRPDDIAAIVGLDVADTGVNANAMIERRQHWVSPVSRWNGMNPIETGSKATALLKDVPNVERIKVDALGVGAGVAAHLRTNKLPADEVKVSEKPTVESDDATFYRLRDQILWAVRVWLETEPNAMLPPDPQLTEEMMVLTYEPNFQGDYVVMPKNKIQDLIGRSPDSLDALALTFQVGKQWVDHEFVKV